LSTSKAKLPHYWRVLKESSAIELEAGSISVNGHSYACRIKKTDESYPASYHPGEDNLETAVKGYGRSALGKGSYDGPLTPAFITPSALETEYAVAVENIESIEYGAGINIDLGLSAADYGNFVHRCLELFMSRPDQELDLGFEKGVVLEAGDKQVINKGLGNFHSFITAQYPASNLLYEIPVNGMNEEGAIVAGIVDLLIEQDEGYWIIDHKSDQVENLADAFSVHVPQLMAYKKIIDGYQDKPVLGVGIHWVRKGQVSMVKMGNH
jgi:hypothetical protein